MARPAVLCYDSQYAKKASDVAGFHQVASLESPGPTKKYRKRIGSRRMTAFSFLSGATSK